MNKVVLLGMNNPLSSDPKHALFPAPSGCTGHRIWRMLNEACGASRGEYLAGFDRRNVLDRRTWSRTKAAWAVRDLVRSLAGREIVVFGEEARKAVGLPRVLIHPTTMHGARWRQLPHPSGRCLWYNDAGCRMLAGLLLAEMYEKGRAP